MCGCRSTQWTEWGGLDWQWRLTESAVLGGQAWGGRGHLIVLMADLFFLTLQSPEAYEFPLIKMKEARLAVCFFLATWSLENWTHLSGFSHRLLQDAALLTNARDVKCEHLAVGVGSQCLSKKKKPLALSEEEDEMYSKVTPFNRPITGENVLKYSFVIIQSNFLSSNVVIIKMCFKLFEKKVPKQI